MRAFNSAANFRTTTPYRIELSAAARDWHVTHDTGWIEAIGAERDYTDWVTHTWYGNRLDPTDSLTISLIRVSRPAGTDFWPDFSLQFQRIRLTLNTSFEAVAAAQAFESWLYGDYSSPMPPPPP